MEPFSPPALHVTLNPVIRLISLVALVIAAHAQSLEQRVSGLLSRMTAEEKAAMLSGSGWMESHAVPRLGIPAIKMCDGPLGVRNWVGSSAITQSSNTTPVNATAFPAGVAMAATWDPDVVRRSGAAIAQEVKALGRDMLLGPTVNINRVPLWGRNFEGYGEDPYLAARMGVAYIQGVQGESVIPSVKHFAANNQEFERHRVDASVDERALHEIYFPAFKAAVQEAGVWTVMAAYEKLNGRYCAENVPLLKETLKQRWGFQGFVISDWGGSYSTAGSLQAGLDLEMPGGQALRNWLSLPKTRQDGNDGGWLGSEKVLAGLASGEAKQDAVDDAVRRILRVILQAKLIDQPHTPTPGVVDSPEHRALARSAAAESIVLLKNAGSLLPLDTAKIRSIAVAGPNAPVARTGGGGSSLVRPAHSVAPLDGIKERARSIQVQYADSQGAAVALARKSDVAVVVVGLDPTLESEGFDRASFDLPAEQESLIAAVAAANPHTAVVITAGSPVGMTKWIAKVPAVLDAWYGGQEVGHAIADVLFGAVNPSGKLPVTFPKQLQDVPAMRNYPGENLHVTYAEGIYVGYRGFDKNNIEPLFPFGHGLSYTTFEYTGLQLRRSTDDRSLSSVSFTLRNTGRRAGAEVAQLYIHDPHSHADRPPKELKGFRRVVLNPGQSQTVTFPLDRQALAYYDPARHDWVTEPGRFEVLVASSSRLIRLRGTFDLEAGK